jgi:hypothetical protein
MNKIGEEAVLDNQFGLKNCKNIKCLFMNHNNHQTNLSFTTLISNLKNLKFFSFTHASQNINIDSFCEIQKCLKLKKLDLTHSEFLSKNLPEKKKLKKLILKNLKLKEFKF